MNSFKEMPASNVTPTAWNAQELASVVSVWIVLSFKLMVNAHVRLINSSIVCLRHAQIAMNLVRHAIVLKSAAHVLMEQALVIQSA